MGWREGESLVASKKKRRDMKRQKALEEAAEGAGTAEEPQQEKRVFGLQVPLEELRKDRLLHVIDDMPPEVTV